MIHWTGGNILNAETEYIAQGVATGSQEGLGTGLALKISTKWPEAQKLFKKFTRNNKFTGGDIFCGFSYRTKVRVDLYSDPAGHVPRRPFVSEQGFKESRKLLHQE